MKLVVTLKTFHLFVFATLPYLFDLTMLFWSEAQCERSTAEFWRSTDPRKLRTNPFHILASGVAIGSEPAESLAQPPPSIKA
jgi:hypothetical protein